MPIHILHGDNQVSSRNKRATTIATYQSKGYEIRVLEGESLLAKDLSSTLATQNLFAQELVVIDNLLSRLKSKEKEACLKILSADHSKDVLLWEKKEVTATALKPFLKSAQIEIFKETKTLFPMIDALIPNNQARLLTLYHQALKSNDVMLIFGMLARRVTDLIIAVDSPTELKGSPWGIKQIISQSKAWTLPSLLALHSQLLDIDLKTKTGGTKLDLVSQLDLLFLEL